MTVGAVYQAGSTVVESGQNKTMTLGDGLGKDSFLQLLITQMRHQDPLEPVKDTEYIAQLAQFNSLEQMQNLNDKVDKMLKWSQMTQASGLIGKEVDGVTPDGTISGAVKEVRYVEGEPRLVVGSQQLSLSEIAGIYEKAAQAPITKISA
ncbi:MAG: flagellar hook capping protein [Actinobacteria bacterium]|nr:flagellar hook capping protein [Actinomycetota bacterium]